MEDKKDIMPEECEECKEDKKSDTDGADTSTEKTTGTETSTEKTKSSDSDSPKKKSSSHTSGDSARLKSECEGLRRKLRDTEERLEKAEAEAADKYARLAAEYDNFRKRSQKERESVYADAVSDTVMGIVPIIDNLMYADRFGDADNPEKFAEGVRLILSGLPEVLEKMNISVFGAAGEQFDPNLHNAVMHVEDSSYGEGEIVDVLQCGYKLGDKVIRYAMVKVAN